MKHRILISFLTLTLLTFISCKDNSGPEDVVRDFYTTGSAKHYDVKMMYKIQVLYIYDKLKPEQKAKLDRFFEKLAKNKEIKKNITEQQKQIIKDFKIEIISSKINDNKAKVKMKLKDPTTTNKYVVFLHKTKGTWKIYYMLPEIAVDNFNKYMKNIAKSHLAVIKDKKKGFDFFFKNFTRSILGNSQ